MFLSIAIILVIFVIFYIDDFNSTHLIVHVLILFTIAGCMISAAISNTHPRIIQRIPVNSIERVNAHSLSGSFIIAHTDGVSYMVNTNSVKLNPLDVVCNYKYG